MPFVQLQSPAEQRKTCERVLRAFVLFCRQEFGYDLYDYQLRIASACLESLFVTKKDVAIAISRQSGKTESITLIIRFLLIFHKLLTGAPLMCGLASPKGEQAKTSLDRIKLSVAKMRDRWQVEDREFNAATVRAFRFDTLHGEIFRFSLAPTTSNESKTLNLLIVDEAHLTDDAKRSNELDPMLSSTGGVTFFIGVGCTRMCDFYRAKNGQTAGCVAIVVPVDQVIRDRRKKYEETGDPKHLEYEKAFEREVRKKGPNNPELRRNYFLEDQVEAGNFISRERFLSCGRRGENRNRKGGLVIPCSDLTLSLDWGRVSDWTWAGLTNRKFDLIDMWKIDRMRYEQQIEQLLTELKATRTLWRVKPDGTEEAYEGSYFPLINTVRGDSTGMGDFPMEYLQDHSGLPAGEDSLVKFTPESKNEMFTLFDAALFREENDPQRYSYPAEHALAGEFEEQMTILLREYKTDRELLSPHAPEEPGAHDDAPCMAALGCLGAAVGGMGDILFI